MIYWIERDRNGEKTELPNNYPTYDSAVLASLDRIKESDDRNGITYEIKSAL